MTTEKNFLPLREDQPPPPPVPPASQPSDGTLGYAARSLLFLLLLFIVSMLIPPGSTRNSFGGLDAIITVGLLGASLISAITGLIKGPTKLDRVICFFMMLLSGYLILALTFLAQISKEYR